MVWEADMKTVNSLLLSYALLALSNLAWSQDARQYTIWGNPANGRTVFAEKGCGRCHAINGVGPQIGPDLGKKPDQLRTITQIAGTMWNHAPEMRKIAEQRRVRWVPFRQSEMNDLIAFLYFLQVQDSPGDVLRGRRLFDEKHCSNCHALSGQGQQVASDLSRWRQLRSPILWAEIMLQHAVEMEQKMRDMGLEWPQFQDNEMVDLIAFIQSETK
jgi:mono/diheme cytochrome c family protein